MFPDQRFLNRLHSIRIDLLLAARLLAFARHSVRVTAFALTRGRVTHCTRMRGRLRRCSSR
jgi:hypothetical protein